MNDQNATARLAAAKRLVSALEALEEAQEAVRAAESAYAATGAAPMPSAPAAKPTSAPQAPKPTTPINSDLLAYMTTHRDITVKEGALAALGHLGPMNNADLLSAMLLHGFPGLKTTNAADALRGAVWHLMKAGEVEKLSDGRYDLRKSWRDLTRDKVG